MDDLEAARECEHVWVADDPAGWPDEPAWSWTADEWRAYWLEARWSCCVCHVVRDRG